MIQLSNNAKVLAAFLVPPSHGMKPNGVVLAETTTDFVVWNIYWDGPYDGDDAQNMVWEAEQGHYFQKSMHPTQGDPLDMAEFEFGLKLKYHLTDTMARGVKA